MSDTVNEIDLNDIEAPKKKRGRPKGSTKKKSTAADTNPINLFQEEEDLESEKRALREKLLQYSDHNPDIVMKPVNDKITKLVKDMDIDELRARCRQGKKICSSRMDNAVGSQIITLANESIGRFLDCVDELHYSTKKDQLLTETTTQYFSLHILDYIPDEIKIAGLYGSHIIQSYYESQQKKDLNKPPSIKVETVEESVEPEPRPELIPLTSRETMLNIKPTKETKDIKIVPQPEII
jgi:hypothetical protein